MKKILILFIILFIPLKVSAASEIIVMDIDSGRILYEKNSNEKRLIASTTKIMTAIIAIENMRLDKTITVGDEVLKAYGTNIYIEPGEKITIKELLYGLILRSGNDAALTLSQNIKGKEKNFIKLMNKKAFDIGMKNTIFENVHGLDEETKNYSTAYDMALLSIYAYKNKIYRNISSTKKYIVKSNIKTYEWYNRNKLLRMYKNCTSGKNGYTPSAGKTLVTTASKDDMNLTIVTLNDPDIYNTHENLYNYYFNRYKNYTIINKDTFKYDESIINKKLYIKDNFIYPLEDSEVNKIETKLIIDNKNKEEVGKIEIKLNNKKLGEVKVYAVINKKKKEQSLFRKIMNWIF